MRKNNSSALLFEQLKSFASLAATLNLSQTVRDLGSTRQTVRRHITQLEEMRGAPLFRVEDRRYSLTDTGQAALREAEALIARGEAWLNNASGHNNRLFHLCAKHVAGFTYYLQQQPLQKMWHSKSTLLPFGLQCWGQAQGEIEAAAFQPLRPFVMIFRRVGQDWVCVEVGDESSFASWYGWERARSSVGHGIANLPGGSGFANLLAQPFQETSVTQGVRLDHIHTKITGPDSDELVPISYERLLLGCFFPDGSPAIAALINRTHDIDIPRAPKGTRRSMPERFLMKPLP